MPYTGPGGRAHGKRQVQKARAWWRSSLVGAASLWRAVDSTSESRRGRSEYQHGLRCGHKEERKRRRFERSRARARPEQAEKAAPVAMRGTGGTSSSGSGGSSVAGEGAGGGSTAGGSGGGGGSALQCPLTPVWPTIAPVTSDACNLLCAGDTVSTCTFDCPPARPDCRFGCPGRWVRSNVRRLLVRPSIATAAVSDRVPGRRPATWPAGRRVRRKVYARI